MKKNTGIRRGKNRLMKTLRLYWSRSKPNFGDCLSPIICEMEAGCRMVYAKKNRCDLVAVGSLLDRFHEHVFHRKIHVWGTGFIEEQASRKARFHYHALRGKSSASLLKGCDVQIFGDPGLLADRIWPELKVRPKKYRVGVIPHYEDRSLPRLKEFVNAIPGAKVIDVFDEVRGVLRMIAECEFIYSSSLHGLIVADAFGVPNAWVKLSDRVRGDDFKFIDYYSAFGWEREQVNPVDLLSGVESKYIESLMQRYSRTGIEMLKDNLSAAFPFRP
ncbi:polysaccharide pyruvyl transferase family protein [Verrucomicrobia bacterium S94]|nr:polysaccharide pyruvyl transferase family protein [Verrucomicrobia bacterium S94]